MKVRSVIRYCARFDDAATVRVYLCDSREYSCSQAARQVADEVNARMFHPRTTGISRAAWDLDASGDNDNATLKANNVPFEVARPLARELRRRVLAVVREDNARIRETRGFTRIGQGSKKCARA